MIDMHILILSPGQLGGGMNGLFMFDLLSVFYKAGSLAAAGMYNDRQADPLGQQTLILTDIICQSYP